MIETQQKLSGMYRFTSLGRPIDPAYLTNRALLIVLPVVALLSAVLASLYDVGTGPVQAAFSGALTAFAAWALTRELAPDDNGAAFVALAFAWTANIAFGVRHVMLLFVAIVVVRVVNRSVGLPLRVFDTIGVLGFSAWAAMSMQQPLILIVASLAFLLDAQLKEPLRRHLLAAAGSLGLFAWMLMGGTDVIAGNLTMRDWSLIGASAIAVVLFVMTSPEPVAYCDTSPRRLDRVRVSAGLIVAWLMGVQAILTTGRSAWLETPIWVCLLALLPSFLARRASGMSRDAS